MKAMKKYLFPAAMAALTAALWLIDAETGRKATGTMLLSFREMLKILPPVFVLLGLLDVWVPRETMMKLMGEKSGIIGVALSLILGSAAAGPLYAAFPIAAVFMRKGVKFSNIMLFIGAWSTTKIPMLMFELASMGPKFTLTRLAMSIIGIFGIAFALGRMMDRLEIEKLYMAAEKL